MITNTESQDPMFNLLATMSPRGRGIEEQEAQGQRQLVASSQLPSKNNGRENVIDFYKGIGIEVIGETKGDKMFLDVRLPEGWAIKPTDHSMWSNLIDNNGAERASIFYKAAFYDRDAFINMNSRYHTDMDMDESNRDRWRCNVVDRKTGNILKAGEWGDYSHASNTREEFWVWLDQNYPDRENPLAYWND